MTNDNVTFSLMYSASGVNRNNEFILSNLFRGPYMML